MDCPSSWLWNEAVVETALVRVQEKVFSHAEELFEEGDTNHDGNLSSAELQELLLKACSPHNANPSSQCHCSPSMAIRLLQLL